MASITPHPAFTLQPVHLPSDALLRLHAANPVRYPALLQSAAHGEPLGRYDLLFAFPQTRLTLQGDGSLQRDDVRESSTDFLSTLDAMWREQRVDAPPVQTLPLPFFGGWFVFLAYEFAGEIEPSLSLPQDSAHIVAQATRIPAAIVVRHADATSWLMVETQFAELLPELLADIAALTDGDSARPLPFIAGDLNEESPEKYLSAAKKTLEHIRAGDIYQANLSRAWRATLIDDIQPHHLYAQLRQTNPAPFSALALLGDRAIISSTPERLIEVRDGLVSTRPIAGTRPRTQDRSDDVQQLRELHAHPKERAEHIMLIDLERNDLGRICEAGSVQVDEFMTLESYAHVHHIVSNVSGRLRSDVTPGQALAAVFPGGTITGCPKVRCMQIIGELEGEPRGAYTGSMGYINRDGSMDFNILIRTLEMRGREISFRAGAGIVADSEPDKELEETRAKARGLVRALLNE